MKITNYTNFHITENSKQQQSESNKSTPENKQVQASADKISGNYNVAFFGLFKKKDTTPTAIDVRYLWYDHVMRAEEEYLINENSKFTLGQKGYTVDLSAEDIQSAVKNLKKGEEIIIGREGFIPKQTVENPQDMDKTVSRKHLKIYRNKNGDLLAQDLNSMNGTRINKNIFTLENENTAFPLKKGNCYVLPYKSVISAGIKSICLQDFKDKIKKLKDNESITIGSKKPANIIFPNSGMSNEHIRLSKHKDGVMVENLQSSGTAYFSGVINKYQTDCSNICNTVMLKKNVQTKIPNDCQIYLGNELTIDVRNKNILNELEKKDKITIGRSTDCDFIVPEFYNQVSRHHLKLEKDGNDIIATELGSMNGTEIIPKNCIKPFYGDLKNLSFSQSNIGDCFLLANLYAMAQTPVGRDYLKNMVSVANDGSYIVKFAASEPIRIAPDELDGQKEENRPEKKSVSGDLGIKAIERAYGRMLKQQYNEFLLDQDNQGTLYNRIDEGGYLNKALQDLIGVYGKCHYINYTDIRRQLYDLEHSGLENNIITCSTPHYGEYNGYTDPDQRFITGHAYAIKNINSRNQTITIVNPHNTKIMHVISWDEFEKYFDYLYNAYVGKN